MTNPEPLERVYTAHQQDVQLREQEIIKWEALNLEGKGPGPRPEPLKLGEQFVKIDKLPQKAIFWTQGIKVAKDGSKYGKGMLNLELILVDKLGFDLSKNAYSLNETIRVLIRVITPFLVLFLAAFVTSPDDKKRLDRFFVKMKTPTLPDPKKDAKELAISYANPHRFDSVKLFPNTSCEFNKWNKVDAIGFLVSVLALVGIIAMLYFLVSLGG